MFSSSSWNTVGAMCTQLPAPMHLLWSMETISVTLDTPSGPLKCLRQLVMLHGLAQFVRGHLAGAFHVLLAVLNLAVLRCHFEGLHKGCLQGFFSAYLRDVQLAHRQGIPGRPLQVEPCCLPDLRDHPVALRR